ncbi:MAG: hypothetical protein H6Q84_225 [Deltaproteobacteria bacterium]|nr:hypothetical protein [Deltaproteobacteria bacterium]
MTMRSGKPGQRRRGNAEAGFTLIEVLTALVILSIAMTAVFATFLSQQQTYTSQSRVAEMQQNLRAAADYMTRDLRLAGYGMPLTTGTSSDNVVVPASANPAGITTIRSLFAVDNTAGPDQVYVLYLYDMDANQPPTDLTAAMADFTTVAVDNTVAHGFLSTGNELALVTDGITADLYQTTAATATSLTFGGDYTAGHTKLYGMGPPVTVVAKARFVRYFIDNTTDPDHPTLMVDRMIAGQVPQPVADDIEDLQLTYGLDTDGDGVVDTIRSGNGGTVLAAGEIPRIRRVRLHLVARSRRPEKDWSGIRPAVANRAGAATTDGYRRRTIEVNIDVRNSGT